MKIKMWKNHAPHLNNPWVAVWYCWHWRRFRSVEGKTPFEVLYKYQRIQAAYKALAAQRASIHSHVKSLLEEEINT